MSTAVLRTFEDNLCRHVCHTAHYGSTEYSVKNHMVSGFACTLNRSMLHQREVQQIAVRNLGPVTISNARTLAET